jgi:hypothetical protein
MTGSPHDTAGRPLCVVTRLEFPSFPKSIPAALRFLRLRRSAQRRIDGLIMTWMRWSPPSTVMFFSLWEDERGLLAFTTLDEHVEAVRSVIRAKGRVWSGVFELAGTSSMSAGWIGAISRWKPRSWVEREPAP